MGKEQIDLSKVKRVLICIFKYHGDVLLTSPVYTALKKGLPESSIDVYLFKETRPMLEGHPAISNFLEFDQTIRKRSFLKRMFYEFSKWCEVRKNRYDLVINLTSGDRGAFVAKVSRAPVRIGMSSKDGRDKSRYFTKMLRETLMPRHIVERNLDAVRALGIIPSIEDKNLIFMIPDEEKKKINKLVKDDFILVHPVSRCEYKNWSERHFSTLIENLVALGEKVVISGGGSLEERAFIDKILKPIAHLKVENLVGQVSLKGLGALIERSKLLITVDSVPSHIASALQKPLLVIFGPSDDIKWGPWLNPHAAIVRLDVPCKRCDQEGCGGSWQSDCLIHLSPRQVLEAALKALPLRTN